MNIIETDRLVLSKFTLNDARFIIKLLNEPAFINFIGDKGVRNVEQAKTYLKDDPIASYKEYGFGLYQVILKDKEVPIGICGLKKRDFLDVPDLGYALLQKYWNRGYASESAEAVLEYANRELGLNRIAALTAPNNIASEHVLKKIGFRFERMIDLPDHETETKLFCVNI